jgi:hypothetical protein
MATDETIPGYTSEDIDVATSKVSEPVKSPYTESSGSFNVTVPKTVKSQAPTKSQAPSSSSLFLSGSVSPEQAAMAASPVSSPAPAPSYPGEPGPAVQPSSVVSLSDLEKVQSIINPSEQCLGVSDISKASGLSSTVVSSCLDYLVKNKMISADKSGRYCSIIALQKLQDQLLQCVECRNGKS